MTGFFNFGSILYELVEVHCKMTKNFFLGMLITFILIFYTIPLSAAEKNDCRNEGMLVKNLTTIDLWYRKNGGACTIWIHDHVFGIKPKDKVNIFSDMVCKKPYCNHSPTYRIYKDLDMNGDCRVRILPQCTLSDM